MIFQCPDQALVSSRVSDGAGGEVSSLIIARHENLWEAAANAALHPIIVELFYENALSFHILGRKGENLKQPLVTAK